MECVFQKNGTNQFFWRREIEDVDGRVRRSPDCGEVGAGKRDGHDVVLQHVEVLFRHVVVADGVFEGQVELVIL